MLPKVSNTMDQAWLALTQARDVLTQARNALIEARFVADVTWSRWARRGERTCKWLWGAGLGAASADGCGRRRMAAAALRTGGRVVEGARLES